MTLDASAGTGVQARVTEVVDIWKVSGDREKTLLEHDPFQEVVPARWSCDGD